MNGNVFQCFEVQADRCQFVKIWEALGAYVSKTLNNTEDLYSLFDDEEMTEPVLEEPAPLEVGYNEVDKAIWDQDIKEFSRRRSGFRNNLAAVQAIILGQCSEAMKDKLKSYPNFKEQTKKVNCCWLLQQIRRITLQFDEKKNAYISIMNAQRSFLSFTQFPGQTLESFRASLRGWAVTLTQQGGSIAANFTLVPAKITEAEDSPLRTDEERKKMAYDKTFAIALVTGADPTKFGTLIAHLSNQYAMGKDEYPTDETSAFNLLVHYVTPENARRPHH